MLEVLAYLINVLCVTSAAGPAVFLLLGKRVTWTDPAVPTLNPAIGQWGESTDRNLVLWRGLGPGKHRGQNGVGNTLTVQRAWTVGVGGYVIGKCALGGREIDREGGRERERE